jgi:hypothetical protein
LSSIAFFDSHPSVLLKRRIWKNSVEKNLLAEFFRKLRLKKFHCGSVHSFTAGWVYDMGWPWTPQSFTRARHAQPFYAMQAGHPWNGLSFGHPKPYAYAFTAAQLSVVAIFVLVVVFVVVVVVNPIWRGFRAILTNLDLEIEIFIYGSFKQK